VGELEPIFEHLAFSVLGKGTLLPKLVETFGKIRANDVRLEFSERFATGPGRQSVENAVIDTVIYEARVTVAEEEVDHSSDVVAAEIGETREIAISLMGIEESFGGETGGEGIGRGPIPEAPASLAVTGSGSEHVVGEIPGLFAGEDGVGHSIDDRGGVGSSGADVHDGSGEWFSGCDGPPRIIVSGANRVCSGSPIGVAVGRGDGPSEDGRGADVGRDALRDDAGVVGCGVSDVEVVDVVIIRLFDVGKNGCKRGRACEPEIDRNEGEFPEGVEVVVEGEADLFEIVVALSPARRFPRLLNGWEQEGDQHGDDADDDQQFDQGKSVSSRSNGPRFPTGRFKDSEHETLLQ